jgi:hypothetical protein
MTTTLETLALTVLLGIAVTTTTLSASLDSTTSVSYGLEPAGSGGYPPPPQN